MSSNSLLTSLWDTATADVVDPARASSCDPKYRELGPVVWAVERLRIKRESFFWDEQPEYADHKWDGTKNPFVAVSEAIAKFHDVGVESATGTGKTFLGGLTVLWFLDCYPNVRDGGGKVLEQGSLVVTTAPKEDQLKLHIWKEIRSHWPAFQKLHPAAKLSHLRIQMEPGDDGWAAHGFACGVGADEESATKAQGFHRDKMLIITEETPGIHGAVMNAFENTCTWETNVRLAFGNPDAPTDQLHKFCERPSTVHVRVSALDHPNVVTGRPIIPGAVSRKKVAERKANYGEGSRLYKSRVRGMCPSEASDALIRWAWLQACVCKDNLRIHDARLSGVPAMGVDVANSSAGDKACYVRGQGPVVEEILSQQCPDANAYTRETVISTARTYNVDPKNLGIDSVGIGAGAVNEAKRLGFIVRALNGAATPRPTKGEEEFNNLRSQMYWTARVDVEKGEVIFLEEDPELFDDLTAITWEPKNGKITVVAKEKAKETLGRSTDRGDAFVYWNWVRKKRSAASTGGTNINI